MQLRAVDIERLDHPDHQLGEQAGPIGVEQASETACNSVIVECPNVISTQTKQLWSKWCCPFANAIDRLTMKHKISHHDTDHDCWVETQPLIIGGHVMIQEFFKVDQIQEMVDQGHGAELFGYQIERFVTRSHHGPLLDFSTH